MREIKFRAWHKGFDRPSVRIPIQPTMLYEDRMGQCLTWKEQGQPLEIMQFTGMTDKKGKEIYEGDVVKGVRYLTNRDGYCTGCERFIGVVEYDDWWGAYRRKGVKQYEGLSTELRYGKEMEVLGNIYENPELIQQKTPCPFCGREEGHDISFPHPRNQPE